MVLWKKIPRLVRWIFSVVIIFIATMMLFRVIFYLGFNPPGKPFSGSAFIMGLRYDAKFAAMAGLLMLLLSAIPFLNPFKNPRIKKAWVGLLSLIFLLLVFFYSIDYYHYDYLQQRLNASVLNYLEDAGISFSLVWETYPLVSILLGILVLSFLAWFLFNKLLTWFLDQRLLPTKRTAWWYVGCFLVLSLCIFGKLGQFNLRWSDAFRLSDDFKANLALNPFQSFFSTLSFRNSTYDINRVKKLYPLMADYIGMPAGGAALNYERMYNPADTLQTKPNIVLVICESFSAYKSSAFGNPLNTTPFFDSLARNGIFFDRCFTPAYGTARGVWATITGTPDVENPRTASRNPSAVDQHTIINDFRGYQPLYFLGGDPSWANIQGLLTNNIQGLRLYQQDDFKAKKIDVWGISDKNLFLEANHILKQQPSPFFAIIQTADNHRPYTIPEEDLDEFKKLELPGDSLKRYGFISNAEYNAFRYTDFGYRKFMEAASKEAYYANTIFVFVGDHGIRGDAGVIFPKSWTEQGLSCEHVPLLFYAPALLKPQRVNEVCSQLDILPSLASLARIPYRNNTLGRDLFEPPATLNGQSLPGKEKYAFIIDHDVKSIGVVGNDYYFLKNLKSGVKELVPVKGNDPIPPGPATDSIRQHMEMITDAFYETSKYLLLNNKKKN